MPRSKPTSIKKKSTKSRSSRRSSQRSRSKSAKTSSTQATAAPIRSVSFVSLGCPKNLVDSEKMLGLLAEDGLAVVSADAEISGKPGDAIVINTCGFLEASKDESLQVIHDAIRAKEQGKIKRVVVAGCLVQRHRAKMLEWAPGIDAMVGVFDRDHIVEAVRGVKTERKSLDADDHKPKYWIAGNALLAARERGLNTVGLTVQGKDGKGIGYFEDDSARLRLTPRHYAYLRVSEGCNQNCAFCTIPSIRGKMRSKPLDTIASEARELIADGVFELNLIGQDTTSFGDDIGLGMSTNAPSHQRGLPGLLHTVVAAFEHARVPGWVRLMYAYPSNFSDEMIDAIARLSWLSGNGKKPGLVPYIDIPLQHASNRILKAMKRNVTAEHQRELMHKLRRCVPGIAIRTTFISGFPGETQADHDQLLDFIADVKFDALGVFEYSKEEGTVAGTMEDNPKLAVDPDIKAQRRDEIMKLQQKIAFEKAATLAAKFDPKNPASTGERFDVLIDHAAQTRGKATTGVSKGGALYHGRTYFQSPQIDAMTFVQSSRSLSPGELVRCTIVASEGYDLIARPCDELEKRVGLTVIRSRSS